MPVPRSGPLKRYCSDRCRKRIARAQKADKSLTGRPGYPQAAPVHVLTGRVITPPRPRGGSPAPVRLPARRDLASAGPSPAGRTAQLLMLLAAGGYQVNLAAARGRCVIEEVHGRYLAVDCKLPSDPRSPGFCVHHARKIAVLIA